MTLNEKEIQEDANVIDVYTLRNLGPRYERKRGAGGWGEEKRNVLSPESLDLFFSRLSIERQLSDETDRIPV